MNIPVFHDDQHGTAIISTAAILNGLRVVEKNLSDVRMVVSGAGAAAIAAHEPAGGAGDAKTQHRGLRFERCHL
ncbi:hypothetical protein LNO81_21525 [Klebsiella variicola subsp. variicola]|nr:hypothetical protein [Klebsiella variicola subsp. variicola]